MKRSLAIVCIVLIFLAGVGVMSYPLVSSIMNNMVSRSQIEEYTKTTEKMSSEETIEMFEEADRYNKSLNNNVIITDPFDQEAYEKIGAEYERALNVDGNGLIGYIDVPKINVYLPVKHGTSDDILQHSAGHLQNTSLPIGGKSTHAVISAHTAFPGETFFDYLTDLEEGDEFYFHVLDRTLKYEVDSVKVVLPEETNDLRVVDGEDHMTLLTCTPYSINTHRLLVRGKRVEFDDTEYITTGSTAANFTADGIFLWGYKIPYWAAVIIIIVIIAVVITGVIFVYRRLRKKDKHLLVENDNISKDGD